MQYQPPHFRSVSIQMYMLYVRCLVFNVVQGFHPSLPHITPYHSFVLRKPFSTAPPLPLSCVDALYT
jgi:hypothetical protein